MVWGSPLAFLLLLGVVPLIVLLHSLRPRRRKISSTALFLLEKILRERPLGRRVGLLFRHNLLLLLQLLLAVLLVLALADPSWIHLGWPAGDTVAVVDLSASMKARGRRGSRFDEARQELLSLINGLGDGQRMMVIGAGQAARVLMPFTADNGRLREMARALRPTDGPAPVAEAVLFAHSFLQGGGGSRVVVISDGAFEGAESFPWQAPHLKLISVRGGNENVAILGFDFRRLPGEQDAYEIMVRLKNFGSRPMRGPLEIVLGAKVLAREAVDLEGGGGQVRVYHYRGPLPEHAGAHLDIADDFATDNRAYLALAPARVVRILHVGAQNPFLEPLFRSLAGVEVSHIERVDESALAGLRPQYDVVVIDRVPAPRLAEGNYVLIGTLPPGLGLSAGGKILRPRVMPVPAAHPLAKGVRLDDLYIGETLKLIAGAEAGVLARSAETPLIVALEREKIKALVFGFDLLASDLPYRVAYPVLFSNAIEWFRPRRVEFPGVHVQAGQPQLLYLAGHEDRVEIRTPSGEVQSLEVGSVPFVYPDTLESGFYSFKSGGEQGFFAVNLFSEAESAIASRVPSGSTPAGAEGSDQTRSRALLSLWPFLLAAVLALLCVEAFLAFRGGTPLLPLGFRLLALAGVIAALINPRIFRTTQALDITVGADFSRSVGQAGKDMALRVLEEARRWVSADNRVGLLFFARWPLWEFYPRAEFPAGDFAPILDRDETDIQAALQSAAARMGEGRQGRILLISDGNENRGDFSRALSLLRSLDIEVWALPLKFREGGNEAYFTDLVLPPQVDSGEAFTVRAGVESLGPAPARIKLMRDGVIQEEKRISLTPGLQWVSFAQVLQSRGHHTFEVLLESAEDTLAENNWLQGAVEVKGSARVLYLYNAGEPASYFSRLLEVQGYSVVRADAEKSALGLAELSAYDLLVLDNVPAYRLTQAKMEAIERYVRDMGGGLVVLGGPQSFGAGGYYRTPLERVLPVDMRPPGRVDLPQVSLLFLLDKSGSMGSGPQGSTKLDLAKAAAASAAELLNATDQVGILAFDAEWDWVLPFRQVGNGEWISESLSALTSDGGTDLHKAMGEAHRAFAGKQAAVKHLIVLSDGLTDKKDFPSLVRRMAQAGITVSTVSIGQDADKALMLGIARDGKGRAYATSDPASIPRIFTTETLLVARDLLVEKLSRPRVTRAVGPLRGFGSAAVPPLRGYVLTHAKSRAELFMQVSDDPLLVSWRYGLGVATAFTSELSGRWAADWQDWAELPRWVAQVARGAARRIADEGVRTEIQQAPDGIRVRADFVSAAGGFRNQLRLSSILTAGERAEEIAFQQVAPGRYEARLVALARGVNLLTIYAQEETGETPIVATLPLVSAYAKEYRDVRPNTALMSRLVEATGGRTIEPDRLAEGIRRLLTPAPDKGTRQEETWWTLSGLALSLFLVDLALRRLIERAGLFTTRSLTLSGDSAT